ncbi:MAG: hypothetical protein K6E54_06040 [Bacteroidaceae bacterium]|nr:hypothetical protein [Bacteroidaceae bacterium]
MMIGSILFSIIPLFELELKDTVSNKNLDEIVIVSHDNDNLKRSAKGMTASIEEHLAELPHVNLIRRGSYALEPVVNNMSQERLSTTIDGMKIFYACTDKMDPVTSYVESGNLQSISLNSGLEANPQATGNIGGSIDLKLRKVGFDAYNRLNVNLNAGHEFNGNLHVYGVDAAYSLHDFYSNAGFFLRKADDYDAGGHKTIEFSQFKKINAFANLGYRLKENDIIESTFIFDKASDVGYPALNMDVSEAKAIITSLSYNHLYNEAFFKSWMTKIYYNKIIHIMDDTKRPNVVIHMDMPGSSWTSGLFSTLDFKKNKHDGYVNYDIYYNRLFADMTMYPNESFKMYMVTWPDVGTLNSGVALNDNMKISQNQQLRFNGKISYQSQIINDKEGFKALKVFFPAMTDKNFQVVGRASVNYVLQANKAFEFSIGTGWGSRAPTVTEAYGYYLNNTFDQYDYIGNPKLKNESATEIKAYMTWKPYIHSGWNLSVKLDANSFFFRNYIVGQLESRLSAMTIGAEGVKVYGNLKSASIRNYNLDVDVLFPSIGNDKELVFRWTGRACYSIGKDNVGDYLPLISPFDYSSNLRMDVERFSMNFGVKGNARQIHYADKYGETETLAYTIFDISAQYHTSISKARIVFRSGIENLFDKEYSTYSDWNKIPQKGRNFYINMMASF